MVRDGVKLKSGSEEGEDARFIEFKTQVDREDDNAEFQCVARSTIGETESERRRIRVAYGPNSVVVTASATSLKAGETVTLACEVEETSPEPVIQWLKDGEIFQSAVGGNNAIDENEVRGGLGTGEGDDLIFCLGVFACGFNRA